MRLLSCANIDEPPPPAPPRRQASSVICELRVHREPALPDLVEHDLGGHQLGHAGRGEQLVGRLLEQHRAGIGIDQDRVGRRRLEALGQGGARREQAQRRGQDQPRHRRAARSVPTREDHSHTHRLSHARPVIAPTIKRDVTGICRRDRTQITCDAHRASMGPDGCGCAACRLGARLSGPRRTGRASGPAPAATAVRAAALAGGAWPWPDVPGQETSRAGDGPRARTAAGPAGLPTGPAFATATALGAALTRGGPGLRSGPGLAKGVWRPPSGRCRAGGPIWVRQPTA